MTAHTEPDPLEQIVDQVTVALWKDECRFSFCLSPAWLGTVYVEVEREGQGCVLRIQAAEIRTEQLIEDNLESLQERLESLVGESLLSEATGDAH